MAAELDDGEFWLPPQFLTDDDILMDYKCLGNKYTDFSYDWPRRNSDLGSPVESVVGSTETESDEEEFLAGLTRQMARSTLGDDLWKVDTKTWGGAGSPQSTLCSVMCGCKQGGGSSRGSPNCPSRVSSPPSFAAEPGVGMNRNDSAWEDLLYAAAGEVARMRRMVDENNSSSGFYHSNNKGMFGGGPIPVQRKPCPISVPQLRSHNTDPGFHSNEPLPYHHLQAVQFELLRQQQMMRQVNWVQHTKGGGGGVGPYQVNQGQNRARNSNARPMGLSSSAWPTLQQSQQQAQGQQPGSGMRAVFLGNTGNTKRECTGTGVFLPRRVGNPTETRKKQGCSTILLPDRVVQALNLNLEAMDAQNQRCNTGYSPDYDAALKYRNNFLIAKQMRSVRQQPQPAMGNEVRLPQEWTY